MCTFTVEWWEGKVYNTKRTQLFSLAVCQSVDQQTPDCVGDPVADYVELTDGPSIALECQ